MKDSPASSRHDPSDQRDAEQPAGVDRLPIAGHTSASLRQLGSLLRTLYRLVPAAVEAAAVLILLFGFILIHFGAPLEVLACLIVLSVAVGVYVARHNFGEAALALVAGMLPVLTTDWNVKRFATFFAAWAALGLGGRLVWSIALASASEKIYFHAGAATQGYLGDGAGKALEAVAQGAQNVGLGPIEKAEVLREFAFRKIPLDRMAEALEMCGQLSTLWEIDHRTMAVFVADLHRMFPNTDESGAALKDRVYILVRDALVSPADFLAGFAASKRLALGGTINPIVYLALLGGALHDGVPPQETYAYIRENVEQFLKDALPQEPECS